MKSLPGVHSMANNTSSHSLVSLASGVSAAAQGRSPSPVLDPWLGSQGQTSLAAAEGVSREDPGSKVQQMTQQLQRMKAQHEEEVKRMSEDHAARLAAVQAQAVGKMKELIEKVGTSFIQFR